MHGDARAAQPRTRLFQLIYAEEAASHPARQAGSLGFSRQAGRRASSQVSSRDNHTALRLTRLALLGHMLRSRSFMSG